MSSPPVVHLMGAQETNAPWGFENRLLAAFEQLGVRVVSTDFRKQRSRLPELVRQSADLLLVCKGEGIPRSVIQAAPCTRVLWYAEQVGTLDQTDPLAEERRRELADNGPAFDYVFSHDASNLDVYRHLGCTRVGCLPCAAFDPVVHRPLDVPKEFDVVFVGSMTPRRKRFIEALSKRVAVHAPENVWDPRAMNELFNRSRIVLNLHLSELLNTETRLCEVAGAGAFLLSETPSMPELLRDREHAVYFPPGDVDACARLIEHYLKHEEERTAIAAAGHRHVLHNGHTYVDRLRTLLATVDVELGRRIWPGEEYGVLRDKWGGATSRTADFYALVEDQLYRAGLPIAPLEPRRIESIAAEAKVTKPSTQHGPRIFAAFHHVNWENYNLQPALEAIGEVVRYDWDPPFDQYGENWHFSDKQRMNADLFQKVAKAHAERPIDVFFSYVSGRLVFPAYIRAIGLMGVPTINLSLDDRLKFHGSMEPTGFTGAIDLASAYSLCWTSDKGSVAKYEQAGGRAIYLPPGANEAFFRPIDVPRDLDVCFVGQNYGIRASIVDRLRQAGIRVDTFGKGWPGGEIPMSEVVRCFSRAKILLGINTVGDSSDVLCVKGRDFEAPMSGAFYLTQYLDDLADFYAIGQEIVTYGSFDDLVDKVRYYLAHPDEAETIRAAGLSRARRDHTWSGRFRQAFQAVKNR